MLKTSIYPALALALWIVATSTIASARPERTIGLHFSEVSIEGDHTTDVPGLFRHLKYKIIRTSWATNWEQMSGELDKYGMDQYRVTKAVYFAHGWTHIVDPEMVLAENETLAKVGAIQR